MDHMSCAYKFFGGVISVCHLSESGNVTHSHAVVSHPDDLGIAVRVPCVPLIASQSIVLLKCRYAISS